MQINAEPVPIVGQRKNLSDIIQDFLQRYESRNNTQAQDRQTLAALIFVVEGLIKKQMHAEGIDPSAVSTVDPNGPASP